LKLAATFGGGPFSADLVLRILKDGSYRKHLDGLRARLARAMGEATGRLRELGLTPLIEPRAGMFLWCSLPDGMDAADIAQRALSENVVLAPGNAFSLSQSAKGFLRFNVAQSLDPRLFRVLERAMGKGRMQEAERPISP
jgi:DNA-binding transcriptional MocR family regulator